MSKRFDYEPFEEQLEAVLAQDLIAGWRKLSVGQYRLNDKLDVYPKSKRCFYLPSEEWADYDDLAELIQLVLN